MKRFFITMGISVGALFIGAITFSIIKAFKWAKHFGMTYFEFAYNLGNALKFLQLGKPLDFIQLQTGIDFNYEDLRKYFLDNARY
jgi:hypothetical protein